MAPNRDFETRDDNAGHDAEGRAALVVIGMQRARLAGPDTESNIRLVTGLLDRARKDGTQIVFVQHSGPSGSPYERGADGWRLFDGAQPRFPDWVVEKQQFSIFDGTHLAAQLKAVGITHLLLTGRASDDDVAVSAVAAAALGFKAELAEALPAEAMGDAQRRQALERAGL
ncbi:MAG TPA: isochorismatase family protein [Asticcacaulis sp.]|nr:isochorismatase family protein [Asticcacaulis sp.]